MDTFYRFLQSRSGRGEREAHKILAHFPERGARNSGDTALFQHDAAEFLGADPRIRDVYPRIKRALGSNAMEARNAIQIARKMITPLAELGNHAGGGAVAIAQSFDGGILGELGDTGKAVYGNHVERRHHLRRGHVVAESPA